jgi:hypothetical protein
MDTDKDTDMDMDMDIETDTDTDTDMGIDIHVQKSIALRRPVSLFKKILGNKSTKLNKKQPS